MQKLFSLDGKMVRILTFLTDLIILNTLFIVSCIPIVTIGASLTSLTTMWYRILKGKDTDIAYHYFRIFRQNFKQSTFIWLFILLIELLLYVNYCLWGYSSLLSEYSLLLVLPFLFVIILLMSVIFPYIGLFKDNIKNSIVNSVLICILNPIQAIMLVLFNISVLYMSFSSPERVLTAIYVFTFGGFAFCGLMNVTITNKMFDKVKKFTKRRTTN